MLEKMVTAYPAICTERQGYLPHLSLFRITDLLAKILSRDFQNMKGKGKKILKDNITQAH
jgi:hypothetical protein